MSAADAGAESGGRILTALEDAAEVFQSHIETHNCATGACVRLAPAPCQMTCPAGIDVPTYVSLIGEGRDAERSELLLKNGLLGLVLVVLTLGIFLNTRLAFWVAVSIPVVFIGSFSILPQVDVTLNMVSMFAFILTLGIVVDDAIIVGENIYAKRQQGMPSAQAVREGANEMVVPVLYAVGTNILAFVPLIFVPGSTGQFMRDLPVVRDIVLFMAAAVVVVNFIVDMAYAFVDPRIKLE